MASCYGVLLENCRGTDGICSFSREILFSSAGELIYQQLPKDKITEVYHIKNEDMPDIAGTKAVVCPTQQRYASLGTTEALKEAEHLLLLSAPIPELTGEDYENLLRIHLATGSDVTILSCQGYQSQTHSILRDEHDEVAGVGSGGGERVLHAVIFKNTVLQKALTQTAESLFALVNAAIGQGAIVNLCHLEHMVIEVTSAWDAYEAQKKIMGQVNRKHMEAGVTIIDPANTYISPDAIIGVGTRILPGTIIESGCEIGKHAVLGPNTRLDRAKIGEGTSVNSSQIYESTVGSFATVGPFAYIRPGCEIGDHTRLGDFVELKKAKIGNGTKVSHLTYIGDAIVGERVNFGCGTVVVNYDGYHKTQTIIGDDAFIGCNTNLVAPVQVGDRAFTAAGATITKNVPDGALAVSRVRQENKEGWNDRRRARMEKKEK
jgi:bifunctional N-acetylglucosamine-1-phosphate-uridyltransferase/glucosamine-1-phosphate-acetyltransferase GlmU-like protein